MEDRKFGSRSLVRQLGDWRAGPPRMPVYRQLASALRLLVLDGRLPLGVRLPGERGLAASLSISRTSVAAAYAVLREEGFLASRPASGYRTCLPPGVGSDTAGLVLTDPADGMIDLGAAALPATEAVHAAYAAALTLLPQHLPRHGYELAGLPQLRAIVADRYNRRGLPTRPEQVLITHGAQNGLALLMRALARPGDRILIDHPTYAHAIDAIRHASCQPVPVGLPAEGWDVEALAAAVRQTAPRLAYMIADFHNPTGRCMDEPTRATVGSLFSGSDTLLVVDETMVDLWLESPPPPPLAAFAAPASVALLGSTGKSFWGGLRVGWVRADAQLIASLVRIRASLDLGTPVLEQLAAAWLVERGEDSLAPRRDQLRRRHRLLSDLLRDRLPAWRAEPAQGGVTIWAEMPRAIAPALVLEAERSGVRIVSGSRFGVGGAFERHIRLPFTQPAEILTLAMDRLASAFTTVGGAEPARRGDRAGNADQRVALV